MSSGRSLWILCATNIVIVALMILIMKAMFFALGAFGGSVSIMPPLLVLTLGVALSIVGLQFAERQPSAPRRRAGLIVSSVTLSLHSVVILGFAVLFATTRQQTFVIPENYQGEVYVIHNVPDGVPEQEILWYVTYEIPPDGILRTQGPRSHRVSKSIYCYRRSDGSLEKIRNVWLVLSPTAVNLADVAEVGIHPLGSGTLLGLKCPVEYQRFYVGTKAYFLSGNRSKSLSQYLMQHPVNCETQGRVGQP
jgi:hypothetical protein